jgi:hypothetical protein
VCKRKQLGVVSIVLTAPFLAVQLLIKDHEHAALLDLRSEQSSVLGPTVVPFAEGADQRHGWCCSGWCCSGWSVSNAALGSNYCWPGCCTSCCCCRFCICLAMFVTLELLVLLHRLLFQPL